MKSFENQKGQIIVLVLLILFLGLTIALSVVSRTLSDLKQTTVTDESSRAFSAAEAGIEEALRTGAGVAAPVDLGNQANYQVEITSTSGLAEYAFPQKIAHDDTQQIWLAAHNGDEVDESNTYSGSQVKVCWQDFNSPETTALEVSLIYKIGSDYKMEKWAYDANASSRGNNFSSPETASSDTDCKISYGNSAYSFKYYKIIDLTAGAKLALRLRPLYNLNSQPLGVVAVSGNSLTAQGREIVSTGVSGTVTRKVKVFKSYATLPAIFDYVLFSNQDITK